MVGNVIPDQPLYHYCSAQSFFGIANSGSIWLTNSEYANDPNENQIGFNIVSELSRDSPNLAIKTFAQKILNHKFELIDCWTSFIFCLSEVADDLNQWRIYGDNGYGFAVGFKPQFFIDHGLWILLNHNAVIPPLDKIYFSKCIYDYNIQKSIVEGILGKNRFSR